jgi:hypothetical protein
MTQNETPKERPILFSAPMIRAILAGSKTQTRQIVEPRFSSHLWSVRYPVPGESEAACQFYHGSDNTPLCVCPYGGPGERLWVRESWGFANACPSGDQVVEPRPFVQIGYKADEYITDPIVQSEELVEKVYAEVLAEMKKAGVDGEDPRVCRWRSARYLPRWASRLLLEVVSVRVERLQEITEEDAKAEGVVRSVSMWSGEPNGTYREKFSYSWDRINGKASPWADNPWVWVVGFKRVQP